MKHLSFLLSLIIFVFCLTNHVSSKDQYVEPLLFGLKVNIQYDMANMFNRFPFQAGLSLILGLALAGILFFGVITAPFGYMFGVPSEKYIMGDFSFHPASSRMLDSLDFETSAPRSVLLDYVRSEKMTPRTIFSDNRGETEDQQCCQTFLHYFDATVGYLEFWEPGFLQKWQPSLTVLRNRLGGKVGKDIVNTVESTLSTKYTPEFVHSMFYLIPESEKSVRNPACQKRMVCHAHGTLQHISPTIVKIYQKFSKKFTKIPEEYRDAMQIGMYNETLCSEFYSDCRDNAFTLMLKSYLSLLPDKTQINKMPRRKHKMYKNMNFLQ